ncbi:hypothetical protein Vafri_11976, partial [Volvox africanus]
RGGGGRRRGADGKLPPAALTVDDVRKRPLGRDSSGAALWAVGRLPDLQMRLYREHPPSWPKPKKPRAASPPPAETKGGRGKGKAAAADGGGGGGAPKKKKGQKAPPPYLLYELPPEAVADLTLNARARPWPTAPPSPCPGPVFLSLAPLCGGRPRAVGAAWYGCGGAGWGG